jgi:hypothetical protein
MKTQLNLLKESCGGKLYESNGFLVPVLTGSPKEMGAQYGGLMLEHMESAYDILITPGREKRRITDEDARKWTDRVYSTGSMRYRLFYDGLVESTGWPPDKVGMLDNLMEFGIFQSKMFDSFAGCTSILSWGAHSADGGMYIGRNEDWSETFAKFPQVLTVRRPTDGSYKYATMGWPGMVFPLTALNERGVYMDLHDGTSMGGSVVCFDRIPTTSLLSDLMAESPSLSAMVHRFNTYAMSVSAIYTLADESSAAAAECSSLAGTRVRNPDGESMVVVNTFLDDSWSIGKRDSVTRSLSGRLPNMTKRLAENQGKVDAKRTRELMDLKLYDADGMVDINGGCTKPINQDEDITVHQVVTDVKRREMWLKRPAPSVFADWTHFDLKELWQ